jgi:hypothetical protein
MDVLIRQVAPIQGSQVEQKHRLPVVGGRITARPDPNHVRGLILDLIGAQSVQVLLRHLLKGSSGSEMDSAAEQNTNHQPNEPSCTHGNPAKPCPFSFLLVVVEGLCAPIYPMIRITP